MYLKVKVKVGAKTEKVEKISDDTYHISVREKAERGTANRRIIEILRTIFPGKYVRIVSGHHSPSKLVAVD